MSTPSIASIKKQLGISYLGGCNSPKLTKSKGYNVLTYGVYLAPYDLSGYNVCPNSDNCRKYCLNGSGRNKIELIANKGQAGAIQQSRIKKTQLFFQDRSTFMRLLISEIDKSIKQAAKENMQFAVRLNCTSDISPEDFVIDGKNILEIYPDVQFYDYTKVFSRMTLTDIYPNYDLTFSYSGKNWAECEFLLSKGKRISVVFENELPRSFRDYPVINANEHDARFLDTCTGAGKTGFICGLTYKRVANDYKKGKFVKPRTSFVNKSTPVEELAELTI